LYFPDYFAFISKEQVMPEFNGAIDFVGDTDPFVVNLTAGVQYYFELEGSATGAGTLADPFLRLFQGAVQIGFDDDGGVGFNSRLVFTPSASGAYTVDVSDFGNNDIGSYRLRVFEDDFRNSFEGNGTLGSLALGDTVNGNLNYAGDTDQYGFNLVAGQQYFMEMQGSATGSGTLADTVLSLQQNGVEITADDDGGVGFNSRIVFTPTSSGFYTVEARDFLNNDAGTFSLRVAEDDFRNTVEGVGPQGNVGTGGSASGNLNYLGDADIFGTTLVSGLTYRIEERGAATSSGTLNDPFLNLLDGFDAVLAQDDDSGTGFNSRIDYTATFTGAHFLQARSFGDAGTGTYEVLVSEGVGTAASESFVGTSFGDGMNGAGGNDTLQGLGGNDVLRGGSGSDTVIGGGDNDFLVGGRGNDLLRGESGSDTLQGSAGADNLIGGTGSDTFDFDATGESSPGAADQISSGDGAIAFQGAGAVGGDIFDVSGIDARATTAFNDTFIFGGNGIGHLSLINFGNDTIVRGNVDNDAAFEFQAVIHDGNVLASAYNAGDFFL
jgi:Ca2+-binding RTX toxin-like protein